MSGFFDHLKSLIHIDLSGLKSAKVSLFSGNKDGSLVKIDRSDHSVHIQLNVASSQLDDPKKRHQLLSAIHNAVLETPNQPILEDYALSVVEDITKTEQDIQNEAPQTFEYFEDKIPSADLPILRAALYIRSVHQRGLQVWQMKSDIMERYGTRGANIANLCSAGYFESQLKPMYEELATRPNFSRQLFIDNYNVIVDSAPFAVFIGRSRSVDNLVKEVEQKLQINKKYGIAQMNIHAIGAENVHKLNLLLQDTRIMQYFVSEPALTSQGAVMNVQIFF